MTSNILSTDSSFHNINLISQLSNERAESFRVIKKDCKGKPSEYVLEKNGRLRTFFQRVKHAILGGAQSHREKIHAIVNANVQILNQESRTAYIKDKSYTYSELFLASQRYNHAWQMHLDPSTKKEVPLFDDFSLDVPIIPLHSPETAPVRVRINQISTTKLTKIPQNQEPHIVTKGWWHQHKLYHYNEADKAINHGLEAIRIFLSTQKERFLSFIGRIIEAVAGLFRFKITVFNHFHYFRKDEDRKGKVYATDDPLASTDKSTSYWIGHGTCLLSIPLKSNGPKPISINIITDPVEGDLNKILYPRMTRPSRLVDDCPVPHIFMLSHDHLDHYDHETLKKLRKYQPIMLIPEGDAKKFKDLGFKNVFELSWWQTTTIPIEQGNLKSEIKITAVPANHWSGQGPCDGHHANFLGYIIHKDEGDIYFAGDTARLSKDHIATLRDRFNIRSMFQPGGPDEVRKDMESTHQASVDGLWMHFNLMIRNLYEKGSYSNKSKSEFIEEAKKLRTLYMHTKTFKLGNLHFDDTDESVNRVKDAFLQKKLPKGIKAYEEQVYKELLAIGRSLRFQDKSSLDASDILEILNAGVIIPKIGSRTDLAN